MTVLSDVGARLDRKRPVRSLRRHVRVPLSALSFWIAIALPAVYLPLLVVGIDGADGLLLFLGLLGLHVLALVGGRGYGTVGRE